MTNAEKFKEVFGFELDTTREICDFIPQEVQKKVCDKCATIISENEANCDDCPFNKNWWNREYLSCFVLEV